MVDAFAPPIAAVGSVALLAVIFTSVFRIIKINGQREDGYQEVIAELAADLRWCGQGRSVLITTCQRAGVDIPPIIWQERPKVDHPKRRRRKERTS